MSFSKKIERWTGLFLILVIIVFDGACAAHVRNEESKGLNVICFGDSLTEGIGASAGGDFPSLLSQKLGRQVVNAGRHGETTRDALKRIKQDVLEKSPKLVILEFGGNDFLKRIPQQETFDNTDKMVEMIQKQGSMVALATVGIGLFRDEYYAGFKKIARERRTIFIPDIMKGIMSEPELKSDQIHPNDAGYKIIAERIYKAIQPWVK